MYNPRIDCDLIRALYRLKRFYKKPITTIANEMIEKSLRTMDIQSVCKTCIEENNQECDDCILAGMR